MVGARFIHDCLASIILSVGDNYGGFLMATNEELKKLMAETPLTQRQVAEYTETESVETVKGWCSNPESTGFMNMPLSKLKLLKFELAMRQNHGCKC